MLQLAQPSPLALPLSGKARRATYYMRHMKAVCSFCLAKSGGISYDSFMKTITLPTNSCHRPLLERALPLIPLLLVCFALLPRAQAVSPPPDGGYPGGNTAEGTDALLSLSTGVWNTALGFQALNHDTAGKNNTATGVRALFSDTGGSNNTATGVYALYSNINGWYNNAVGAYALANNTSGNNNTANGYGALYFNTEGDRNAANGVAALYHNTTGFINTANGYQALYSNISGVGNTANGAEALFNNDGDQNTANGYAALNGNNTGFGNTANGFYALANNTTGNSNTANGIHALYTNTTGSNNTAVGADAGSGVTTANNVICIGAGGANVTNSCFIGNIREVTTANPNAISVLIDSAGQLGTASSSKRFKKEIKPMDDASESILALKPVTFHYKGDATNTPQFGLIAEEVAAVNPNLVVRDKNGEIYTVRYDQVNAMLLNEFLKEHRKVEQLTKDFESKLGEQQKQIEALSAGLQKVSAEVEMSRAAPQMVVNDQ
jgi:hypothetical protein